MQQDTHTEQYVYIIPLQAALEKANKTLGTSSRVVHGMFQSMVLNELHDWCIDSRAAL